MNKNEDISNNNQNKILIPDIYLEEFQNSITEARIKNLYLKLKNYESKGYITHDKFLQSMKEIFDEPIKELIKIKEDLNYDYDSISNINKENHLINIEDNINEVYELYFLRFREMKCIIKNNKTVFYLTDFKPENFISSYNIICSLIIFLKSCFDNKIRLLFKLTDIDEDGFLNENEIRNMITTCNFLFCEEGNTINTNSSILAQSLTNYKVNEIIKEILYDPGNLYVVLEEEKYINFDVLYKSIKLVKDYKYKIIPCFINLKQCLNNVKKEKVIKINDKHKYDFITISSSLVSEKNLENNMNIKLNKNLSSSYLNSIIKPKKVTDNYENNNKLELPSIGKNFFYRRNSVHRTTNKIRYNNNQKKFNNNENSSSNYNNSVVSNSNLSDFKNHSINKKLIIEKKKTFKELIRECNIIEMEDEKNKNQQTNKNFNKNTYYNNDKQEVKYIFEANFDKIRNIEVEPGLIKFISDSKNKLSNSSINNYNNGHSLSNNAISNKKISKNSSKKNVFFNFSRDKVQEEKSNDGKENKSKTSNNDIKKIKKLNINYSYSDKLRFNFKTKTRGYLKHRKTVNYKEVKSINNPEKINKIPNVIRNNNRKNTNRNKIIMLNKNKVNILNSIYNEARRYKTLDEIFGEIKNQENKYNNDSYGGINASLLRGFDKIKDERKEIKRILGQSDDKDLSLGFHNNYLNKLVIKKKDIFRSKSVC